jgi:membrane protein insertase Oxa1/YidC/SpoIIIJ
VYWLSYNIFTMAQTFYMLRRYHEPLSFADSQHLVTDDGPVPPEAAKAISKNSGSNGAAKKSAGNNGNRSKKNKKGA